MRVFAPKMGVLSHEPLKKLNDLSPGDFFIRTGEPTKLYVRLHYDQIACMIYARSLNPDKIELFAAQLLIKPVDSAKIDIFIDNRLPPEVFQ